MVDEPDPPDTEPPSDQADSPGQREGAVPGPVDPDEPVGDFGDEDQADPGGDSDPS